MGAVLRFLRLVQVALLLFLLLVIPITEFFHVRRESTPSNVIYFVATGLCIWMTIGMFLLRKKIISKAEKRILADPEDMAAWTSWKVGHLMSLACCEALALYGLMLRFLGFGFEQVATFYIAGVGLMLYMTPRPPVSQP
jgi:hypothetical protein